MIRRTLTLLVPLLLAGCLSSDAPETLDDVDAGVPEAPAPATPKVSHKTGSILFGVGTAVPVIEYFNVELMVSAGMKFQVPTGTRALLVELTWDGDVPNDLTLWVRGPDDETHRVTEGITGQPDAPRFQVDDPEPGEWAAGAIVNGVTVAATWDVYASTSAETIPGEYSAIPA